MNSPFLHLTLREWRAHMAAPASIAALIGVTVILTLTGPFETGHLLRAVPRFAYWGVMVGLTYSAGFFANALAMHLIGPQAGLIKRILLGAALTTLFVFPLVFILNGLALGYWAKGWPLVEGLFNVAVIASVVAAVYYMIDEQNAGDRAQQPQAAPLIDRLPFEKRGALVSISVEDHYVRIRTTKGEEMLLMRLSDAIREVGTTHGLQVHRSHWVALDQVTAAVRKGDGAILTLAHGPDIPVSRANVAKIKEAGLLLR